MSRPTPEGRSTGKLVRASDEVIARIEQQVLPKVSPTRRVTLTGTYAFVLTWPPVFVAFAVTTIVVPSLTDGAGVGRTALWALQFAVLIAISAMLGTLRRSAAEREAADPDDTARKIALRLALHALLTAACAGLVLAPQGLSVGQIASLTAVLVVVLHLLPLVGARLLRRSGRGRQAGRSEPTP
ncbi:hypothetical protein [Plantactinospora sp. BB1]|uniref:hypothetical protein n=1 Tax=Plantactinospora sp. BB1 TaxID=2071627 RepID=UPI0026940C8D